MQADRWTPVREAWLHALYGSNGFYRREWPTDHFRTSPQVSTSFAEALLAFARRRGISQVCDVGCGGGGLLAQLHSLGPGLSLAGVELRPRPPGIPDEIGWGAALPVGCSGLVFANELLDNVPCDVVEVDTGGVRRVVEVDLDTGIERLGVPVDNEQDGWLSRWWPIGQPGQRADVGLARDTFWRELCAANPQAHCVFVDYGHEADDRPWRGSLTSYRHGSQQTVTYDQRHDITAHVAIDSVAAAVGGTAQRQREVLTELGIEGRRPSIDQASADPAGYLRALSVATERAELTATGGLGDFWWVSRPPTSQEPAPPS